jgi:hypothetical protein
MNKQIQISAAVLGLFVCLTTGGCGSSSPAAVSDPNVARTTLQDVLESWKKGDASDALSKGSPVIYVADEDWQAGAKLESYQIESNGDLVGTSLRAPVTLKIKDAKGKPRTRKVFFTVTTQPVLRVDRQD